MRAGGETDMTKIIVAARNFANTPKIALCGGITCVYLMVGLQTTNKLRHGRTPVDNTSTLHLHSLVRLCNDHNVPAAVDLYEN
jgi:hypothetical protein